MNVIRPCRYGADITFCNPMGRLDMTEQPQEAMEQDQAEQGLAQQWDDEILRCSLKDIAASNVLTPMAFSHLCGALKIDVRDVT